MVSRNTLKHRARDSDEAQWRNHVEPRWRVASRLDHERAVELAAGLIGKDSIAGTVAERTFIVVPRVVAGPVKVV